ncbi:PBP1A family penicillin-binding protein [Tissierella sp.]|uniref:penicillin-binding protein 1A n=1 Tax=Tissierella sp. TaxID=41274 RepID=UPI00285F8A7B|nr:PBP1A family penicillin-binding protein [Tissierella sp.]MDR7857152.1 PBP1A family penicillin-binding protein [Tissierella sp.]
MQNNNEDKRKKKKEKKQSTGQIISKSLKIFLIIFLMLSVVVGGVVVGAVLSILKDVPEVDPSDVTASLDQTSTIVDANGELIEKIQTLEFRTIVKLNQMPKHLRNAFIAIEDERFETHIGVDPRGIVSSAIDNLKAGTIVRGASTITQQLMKDVYLTRDKDWDRKIKEAYLAIQMEKLLTKDQILEAYLNRVNLGQGAYGVQEGSQTYFSKNVEDLSIAEAALFAGIVKSPTKFAPYKTVSPENFDSTKHFEVGRLEILGQKYIAVYNEEAVNRQKLVLKQMLKVGKITESEYETALNESIKNNLQPGQKKIEGISSYFTDYVKTQTVEALVERLGYTKEEAQDELLTGGLTIYSTMDVKQQKLLEDVYNNFTEILIGNTEKIKGPVLVDWRLSKANNILDDKNNIIFYHRDNLFDEDFNLKLEKGSYEITDGNLYIKNKKLSPYPKHIDVADYYRVDDNKNLVTHTVGSIVLPENKFSISDTKEITISSSYLSENKDFYKIDENENLLINDKYFFRSQDGVVQPQSATVVLDYWTGQIKALVGGRDIEGARILNRATASQRQPGSAMKPIAAYLPALDNGYNAASIIDDIPFYVNGDLWPKNWYKDRYRGIHTLRRSVEQSVNVNSVKMVESVGVSTSMAYLEKLGIISKTDPDNDSFVTAKENRVTNDETLAALGLGGMTSGLTPLEITAAYGAIANGGVYIEPIAFTKILDKNGNVLIDNIPNENIVVSPQVAYIMSDILRTTVSNGIAGRAKISDMAVAGKTGTTQNQADIWFVGFTPYYATSVWIGNDSPKITLTNSSGTAAQLWQHIMTKMHEGLESKTSFNKPDNIVSVNVCTQSGKLPTELCTLDPRGSTVRSEMFVKGTEPKEYCDVHVEVIVDKTNGKIANEYCPTENLETKVFIERTPPYNPSEHNGIVPTDFQYTAPTEICDEHNENTIVPDPLEEEFLPSFPWDWDWDWDNDDDDSNNNDNNGNRNGN